MPTFSSRSRSSPPSHGRSIQFWGDILARYPEILSRVPEGAIVTDWGYEAGHPFEERAAALREAGVPTLLCPGTSGWLSLAGRWSNAAANIGEAAQAAVAQDAAGLLLTDWGDQGHLQPPVVRLPGLLLAAALAWNPESRSELSSDRVVRLLDLHLFRAPSDGGPSAGLLALADLYRRPGGSTFNGSPLFYLLTRPDLPLDHPRLRGLEPGGLEACLSELDASAVERARSHVEIDWLVGALETAARLGQERLRHGARASCRELPADLRATVRREIERLLASHELLWLQSSRPGGLEESAAFLARTGRALAEGQDRS